jgi:hypothetical protein
MGTRAIRRLPVLVLLAVAGAALAACGAGPGDVASASQGVTTEVTSGAEAAAAVAARNPLFDGIGPQDPNVIGASAWWTATPTDAATPPSAWTVVFEVGSGDCQAGCIDRHTWTYLVEQDGTVTFQGETGGPLPDDVLAGLVASATGPGVGGRVTAGPVCPVERPGDASCVPRAVASATLSIRSRRAHSRSRGRSSPSSTSPTTRGSAETHVHPTTGTCPRRSPGDAGRSAGAPR